MNTSVGNCHRSERYDVSDMNAAGDQFVSELMADPQYGVLFTIDLTGGFSKIEFQGGYYTAQVQCATIPAPIQYAPAKNFGFRIKFSYVNTYNGSADWRLGLVDLGTWNWRYGILLNSNYASNRLQASCMGCTGGTSLIFNRTNQHLIDHSLSWERIGNYIFIEYDDVKLRAPYNAAWETGCINSRPAFWIYGGSSPPTYRYYVNVKEIRVSSEFGAVVCNGKSNGLFR